MADYLNPLEKVDELLDYDRGIVAIKGDPRALIWQVTANPEGVEPIHEEIEFVIRDDTWRAVHRVRQEGPHGAELKERPAELQEIVGIALAARRDYPNRTVTRELGRVAQSILRENIDASRRLLGRFAVRERNA